MTDAERNAALAALFGGEGYEAAKECPQGHELEDEKYEIGEICQACDDSQGGISVPDSYWAASRLRKAHEWMPGWHQGWRIQPVPKNFTVPGVLEPLAEKLLARWSLNSQHSMYLCTHQFLPPLKWHFVTISTDNIAFTEFGFATNGKGPTYEIALGEALLAAARNR